MTRLIPRDFADPEPLTDSQVSAMKATLQGFRDLFLILDAVIPAGDAKEQLVERLAALKRESDSAVRAAPRLTLRRVCALFGVVEHKDRRVSAVVMSYTDFAELRMRPDFKDVFDPETSRDAMRRGRRGCIFGAELFVNQSVPANRLVLLEDPGDGSTDAVNADSAWPPERLIAI